MRARKITITLEVETVQPLNRLRDCKTYAILRGIDIHVLQVQANMVTHAKGERSGWEED